MSDFKLGLELCMHETNATASFADANLIDVILVFIGITDILLLLIMKGADTDGHVNMKLLYPAILLTVDIITYIFLILNAHCVTSPNNVASYQKELPLST
ncbi:CMP183.5L [Camelpox virus CMS]|uniref:CMP183.5L n=1 Tax=Camelpox virus (strain CMS) TaxID=203172 RepID=Q8QQ09_CAMPS|nr:CMP183.5L [Camelpox virus CMS]